MEKDLFSAMRQRISFQSASLTPDGGGGGAMTWNTVATVWANIEAVRRSGIIQERQQNGQLQDTRLLEITTRYISGITPAMRILYGSRIFNIRSVTDVNERGVLLKIIAEEGVTT